MENAQTVPQITYPEELSLWQTKIPDKDRLKIINEEDFPRDDILKSLGISGSPLAASFGITDEEEIRERHNLCRFLMGNPDFMNWVNYHSLQSGIPMSEEDFLEFYDPDLPHNPYWQTVHDWIKVMDAAADLPPRLQAMTAKLKAGLPLEQIERDMATTITERLEEITVISGLMDFRVEMTEINRESEQEDQDQPKLFHVIELELRSGEAYGHRKYSQKLSQVKRFSYPAWTKNPWNMGNWIGLGQWKRWRVRKANALKRQQAYQSMVISDLSSSMRSDVSRATFQRLNQLQWNDDKFSKGIVTVFFHYNANGLHISILNLETRCSDTSASFSFKDDFEGYTRDQRLQMGKAWSRAQEVHAQTLRSRTNHALITGVLDQNPEFFRKSIKCSSPNMDREYRWFAIENEYHGEFEETYQALKAHRRFFQQHYRHLIQVISLLRSIKETADKLDVPMCYPEVLSNGHIISFDKLYPTQLLFRLEKGQAVPISSLPELNGQMIGLTGYHGGGKTETEISIVVDIFLAQSGIPIFGNFFRLNVKRVLGMVFIAQRGEGSTCEMLLRKLRKVLEGIKNVDGREVVLVLDEIGTGTQEVAGLELGQDLLRKLAERGVSVIFSTQITSLAEFARDDLGSLCFQLDAKHRISEGVGDGGMKELRRRTGLEKLLVSSN